MSWEFLVTALMVVLMPGTGGVYTLAVALGQGTRAGFVAAFECTLGSLPHMAASILGLAAGRTQNETRSLTGGCSANYSVLPKPLRPMLQATPKSASGGLSHLSPSYLWRCVRRQTR